MIGISTIFYGFKNKNIIDKVEKLVNIFNNVKLRPLVQIGASYPEDDFSGTVSKLLELRNHIISNMHFIKAYGYQIQISL